ncbi:LysR family transcriptional regulator [Nocardia sp. NEAU-G5]|uniref:LysR family transcriptional regulator n=1 Tax=Nocardia albiluteola TaxID=2842303 RepID=A0ABS6B6H8_9NOCA|nr:LysR family transcriptional regulator [Nocardia albiluteola]MBU3065927.1 LysR family transcriptional regulator [Nocardia albiluteola]
MDIRSLGYFIAVAEEASFTRAAERCHVAQPSLSQQIQGLERELGEPLFERLPRQVHLTTAGQVLLPYARVAIAAVTAAKDEFAYRAGGLTGTLQLGLVEGIDADAVAGVLGRFTTTYPGVTLTVSGGTSAELSSQVTDRRLDTAVIALPVDGLTSHLAHRVVHREEIVTMERPSEEGGQPARDRRPASDLTGVQVITYNEASGVHPHIMRYLDGHAASPRIICAANDPALHRALARQGLGIAITAASDLSTADATDLTIRGFDPPLTLTKALIWQRHNNSRVLAAFLALWNQFAPTANQKEDVHLDRDITQAP